METKENNKLIAEFMGISIDGEFAYIEDEGSPLEEVMPINKFNYHSSWDWLMPVVVECFERFGETDTIDYMRLNDSLLEANIDSLYKAVVKCINEYNKTNDKG